MKDWWRTLSFALYFLFCVWIVQGWKVWQISHLSCLQASAFQLRLYSHTCNSPLFEYVCEVHLACAWCMPCSHACAYVFVCVHSSMCACPLGSTGVLSDNTNSPPPLSDPDRTVSWSQQLAAPSAVQHGRKKKKDQHLRFFLLGANWMTSGWPCHACTESTKSNHIPGLKTLNSNTHFLSTCTHFFNHIVQLQPDLGSCFLCC